MSIMQATFEDYVILGRVIVILGRVIVILGRVIVMAFQNWQKNG